MSRFLLFMIACLLLISCKTSNTMTNVTEQKAMNELLHTLQSRPQFVKVHAGEFLIWLGHPEKPRQEFIKENNLHGQVPKYRVVIWRVLAQTETDPEKKAIWTNKILEAFKDTSGPDRIHAAETLGKLKLSPLTLYPDQTKNALLSDDRNLQVYTLWATSYSSDSALEKNRQEFLRLVISDTNEVIRKISAFILRNSGKLSPVNWKALTDKAFSESPASALKTTLFNTAYITMPETVVDAGLFKKIKVGMKKDYQHFSASKRIELALTLAQNGDDEDLMILTSLLNDEFTEGTYDKMSDEAADVRAAAAYAILKIKQRIKSL